MPRVETADVVIVGAGAAGLATAAFTARAAPGRRIVLIDGSPNADEIENGIWNILSSRFPALTANPQSAKTASPAPDRNSQF